MRQVERRFVQAAGMAQDSAGAVTIAYWLWPASDSMAADSERVLALHGLGDHGWVWAEVAEGLGDADGSCRRDRVTVIAPDLRGHGDSGKPEAGYDSLAVIGDLEAVLAQEGWDSAHVVAHSWAAKAAVVWATQSPGRVRSLTLIDPAFVVRMPIWMGLTFPLLYRTLSFLKLLQPQVSEAKLRSLAQGLRQFEGWSALQERVFELGVEEKADGRWASKFALQARDGVFADCLRSSGFSQPWGGRSLLILPERGLNRSAWQLRPYRRFLSNLSVRSVPGNHWPHLGAPKEVAKVLREFWVVIA